jgi:hypothetical protein
MILTFQFSSWSCVQEFLEDLQFQSQHPKLMLYEMTSYRKLERIFGVPQESCRIASVYKKKLSKHSEYTHLFKSVFAIEPIGFKSAELQSYLVK